MQDVGAAFDQQVAACQAYLKQLEDLDDGQKIKRQGKAHSAVERVSKVTAVLRQTIRAPRDRAARSESDIMVHFGNAAERLGLLTVVLEDIQAAKDNDPESFVTCFWGNVESCHKAMLTIIGLLGDLCRKEAVEEAARRFRAQRDVRHQSLRRRFRVAARASIWYTETLAMRDSGNMTVTIELAPALSEVLSRQEPPKLVLVGRTTIVELKGILYPEFLTPVQQQIIKFNDSVLDDAATLASSGLSGEATLVLDVTDPHQFPLQLPEFNLEDITEGLRLGMKFEDGDTPSWSIDAATAEAINFDTFSANLSPLVRIDVGVDARRLAGIPEDAEWFAWSNPVTGMRPTSGGGPADACFVLTGGWVYLDATRTRIVRAACMRPAPGQKAVIKFGPRQAWGEGWSAALASAGRMQRVSLKHMRQAGAMYFCWINPGEVMCPGDEEQERVICPAAGGFAYVFKPDGSPVEDEEPDPDWDKMPGCYFECYGTGKDQEIVPMLLSTALGSVDHVQVALGFGGASAPLALSDEVFASFDQDGNGNLDRRELSAFISAAFPEFPCTEADMGVFLEHIGEGDDSVNVTQLRAFLRCFDPGSNTIRKKTALIIIDVQNDFISGTLANQFNAIEIVPKINAIRDKFDEVVVSYDWHPEHHCSFCESASAGEVKMTDQPREFKFLDTVTLQGDDDRPEHTQVLYCRHAVQNTWGSQTHDDLIVKETDKKVYKGTSPNIDSYSAFFDNCKAKDTGLTAMLSELKVTHIYCVGLVFDICVQSSALHGAEMGFHTTVIEDCTKPLIPDEVEGVKEQLRLGGVKVMSTEEALEDLEAGGDLDFADWMQSSRLWSQAKRTHSTLSLSAQPRFHGSVSGALPSAETGQ